MSDLPRRPTHRGVWIEIERCAGCDGHKDITRHSEEKYKDYAKRLEAAINGVLQDRGIRCTYEVNPGPVPRGDGRYQAMMGSSYYYQRAQKAGPGGTPHRFRYPGLGAFEVYVCLGQRREEVFSKLKSRKWPNPEGLAKRIDEEVERLFGGWEGEGADHKSSPSRADSASPADCITHDALVEGEREEESSDSPEADTVGHGASMDDRSTDKTADAKVRDTASTAPVRTAAETEVNSAAPLTPVPTADPRGNNALEQEDFVDDFEDDIANTVAADRTANAGGDPAATFGKLPDTRGRAAAVDVYDDEYDDFETTPRASASLAEARANMLSVQGNGSLAAGLDVTKRPQTASTAASASDVRDHNSSSDDFSFGAEQTLPRNSGPQRPMSASPSGRRSVHDMPPNGHGDLGRVEEEDPAASSGPAPWHGPESPALGRDTMGTIKSDAGDDVDEYEDEGFEED